ncbi:expressed protein [Phakopsora pachyrhizi]|uniref:Expressed protein n=1 Tax=Phakopsora pachyrhizi TaxID=170000 RepID=A0AAV0AXA3_PHAPC|nr:expressed protein [Phakopsora pachyrhizi]
MTQQNINHSDQSSSSSSKLNSNIINRSLQLINPSTSTSTSPYLSVSDQTNISFSNIRYYSSNNRLTTISGGRYYDEYDEDEESQNSILSNQSTNLNSQSPSTSTLPSSALNSNRPSPYQSCFPPIPKQSSSSIPNPNKNPSSISSTLINLSNNNLHSRSNPPRTISSTTNTILRPPSSFSSDSSIIDLRSKSSSSNPTSTTTPSSTSFNQSNLRHHHSHCLSSQLSSSTSSASSLLSASSQSTPHPHPHHLLSSSSSSTPSITITPSNHSDNWLDLLNDRPLARTLLSLGILLLGSAILVAVTVYGFLPPVAEDDLSTLKIPTSFNDLKKLNILLQVYKTENYYRVLTSYVLIYLFLQAFSLPGSMYLSILAGAMFGVSVALPLVCLCVGTGAMLCYLISYRFSSPLFDYFPSLGNRLDSLRLTLSTKTNRLDLFAYLVVIRISPLPPHWVVNLLAPYLGISLGMFWITTCLGILPVTLIHTQLGTTLDQMVGPEDLSLLNVKNLTGLALVAMAVMVPVGIRWYVCKNNRQDLALDSIVVESRTRPSIDLNFERSSKSINNSPNLAGLREEDREEAGRREEEAGDVKDEAEGTPRGNQQRPKIKRLISGQAYSNLLKNNSVISTLKRSQDSEETLILCDRRVNLKTNVNSKILDGSLNPLGSNRNHRIHPIKSSKQHQRGGRFRENEHEGSINRENQSREG